MTDDATNHPIQELAGEALDRANEVYAAIHFPPSDPQRDRTFGLLTADGDPFALARIHDAGDGSYEAGGFWVREAERGGGLARRLVRHALEAIPQSANVWLLPFASLVPFYTSMGLDLVDDDDPRASADIRKKLAWCQEQWHAGLFADPVVLMVRAAQ